MSAVGLVLLGYPKQIGSQPIDRRSPLIPLFKWSLTSDLSVREKVSSAAIMMRIMIHQWIEHKVKVVVSHTSQGPRGLLGPRGPPGPPGSPVCIIAFTILPSDNIYCI